jgi:hypothetical protein
LVSAALIVGTEGKEVGNEGLRRHMETIEALVSRGATLTRQLLGFARGGSTRSRYTTSLIYSWEVIYYLSIDGGSMAGLPE